MQWVRGILYAQDKENIMGLYEETVKRVGKATLDKKAEENKAYKQGEAASAGNTYQDTPVRGVHAGKYDNGMLQGLGAVSDIKMNDALKKSGAE